MEGVADADGVTVGVVVAWTDNEIEDFDAVASEAALHGLGVCALVGEGGADDCGGGALADGVEEVGAVGFNLLEVEIECAVEAAIGGEGVGVMAFGGEGLAVSLVGPSVVADVVVDGGVVVVADEEREAKEAVASVGGDVGVSEENGIDRVGEMEAEVGIVGQLGERYGVGNMIGDGVVESDGYLTGVVGTVDGVDAWLGESGVVDADRLDSVAEGEREIGVGYGAEASDVKGAGEGVGTSLVGERGYEADGVCAFGEIEIGGLADVGCAVDNPLIGGAAFVEGGVEVSLVAGDDAIVLEEGTDFALRVDVLVGFLDVEACIGVVWPCEGTHGEIAL